ncbi:hypothetical protein AAFC00_002283 [Neodothiora populina]|uniref:Uncharacterized protein n=1 Tax=Neodothiora populina TaxID=2781224 RepID=A0ABR3PH66_9PEZI
MGISPPYMYKPPSHQGSAFDPSYDFDPKAVTRASWTSVSSPKPKQSGPLINFNKHPDSYVILPYGTNDAPPLSPSTRKWIVSIRWVQFGLRIVQLIGALGLLACVICIRSISDSLSWIMRIPPAWDVCIATYAIIHLFRPAKARTPMSSSTYHAFCVFMDLGLIPFMVLTAYYAEKNRQMVPNSEGRWSSFFHATGATETLLFVTWIAATTIGGLHLISACIDVYLVVIFRKIARYPPDVNPLEDNLTSRLATKHRYKNSDLSMTSEKKFANMSGSTLALSAPTSSNIGKEKMPDVSAQPVSFYQSRTRLDQTYSAHTQESARASRDNMYQQSRSARTSHTEVNGLPVAARYHSQSRSRSRPRSHGGSSSASHNRTSQSGAQEPMPSHPSSYLPTYERPSGSGMLVSEHQTSLPANVAKSHQHDSLLSDNWYVMADDEYGDLSSPHRTPVEPWARNLDEDHETCRQRADRLALNNRGEQGLLPEPLKTHAPTPPAHATLAHEGGGHTNDEAFYFSDTTMSPPALDAYGNSHASDAASMKSGSEANSLRNSEGTIGRALTITSAISAVSSLYSQGSTPDLSRAPSPKRKAYGNLAEATKVIRGFSVGNDSTNTHTSPFRGQSNDTNDGSHNLQMGHVKVGGRVVSRTGVDLVDANVMYLDNSGTRSRHVSGKIAEEGMAGTRSSWWNSTMRQREVSGTA